MASPENGAGSEASWSRRRSRLEHGPPSSKWATVFLGASPELISATGPDVWVYQWIDNAGKLFRVTATSRYDAGTCDFTAWGSTQA